MLAQLRPAISMLALLGALTGVVYPLLVTGVAQQLFPQQANGSILRVDGRAVGSRLIGQQFSAPGYFWGRLSATGPDPYNAGASSGSNLGPLNSALRDAAATRIAALRAADPGNGAPVPVTANTMPPVPTVSPSSDPQWQAVYQRYQQPRR